MTKRTLLIHGWGGNPNEHWFPWLKGQLESNGFEVIVPAMPDTEEPVTKKWVGALAKAVGDPDEQTYFIGHSIGCQTIMRYLETIAPLKVGGCVFIAGWFKLANLEGEDEEKVAGPWLNSDIDFTKVLSATGKFIVVNSSNDDYGFVEENKRIFEEKLEAKVMVLENKGHFTASDGVTELPEALLAVQELENSGTEPFYDPGT